MGNICINHHKSAYMLNPFLFLFFLVTVRVLWWSLSCLSDHLERAVAPRFSFVHGNIEQSILLFLPVGGNSSVERGCPFARVTIVVQSSTTHTLWHCQTPATWLASFSGSSRQDFHGFPSVLSSFQTKHAQGTIKDIPVLSPLLQFFFALSGQANPRLQKEKHHGRPNTPVSQKIRSFNLCCELQHGCFSAATGVFDPSGLGVKRQLVLYLSEPSEHRAVNQSQWHSLEARQGNESMSVQYAQLFIDKFVATGDTVLHGSQLGCRSCDENYHLMECAVRSDETIYMNLRTILPYCNNLYHILPWLQLAALHCVWQKSTIVGTFAPNPVNSYRTRDNSCHMLSYNECIVRHSGQAKLAPLLTSGNCICESI